MKPRKLSVVLVLLALLLTAPAVQATRTSLHRGALTAAELPPPLPSRSVLAAGPPPALPLLSPKDRAIFTVLATLDEPERGRLLVDLRRFRLTTAAAPLSRLEPRVWDQKTASRRFFGPGAPKLWEPRLFSPASRQWDLFLEPDPLGPVDSPNLYQAFGFDGLNVRDPSGMGGPMGITPGQMIDYMHQAGPSDEAVESMREAFHAQAEVVANRHALSLAAGFVPGVGDIKDIQEVVTGRDVIAGDRLGWGERVVTGLAAVVPLVPGKALRRVGRPLENVWNEFQRFTKGVFRGRASRREAAEAFGEFTSALRVAHVDPREIRIVTGTQDRVAVIGRWMKGRVEPTAEYLRAKGWFREVETFKPSSAAIRDWEDLMRHFPNGVPNAVAVESLMYKENMAWIERIRSEGYTVLDVGEGGAKLPSTFYEMEKRVVYGR